MNLWYPNYTAITASKYPSNHLGKPNLGEGPKPSRKATIKSNNRWLRQAHLQQAPQKRSLATLALRRSGQGQGSSLPVPNPAGNGDLGTPLSIQDSIVEDMVTIYAEELFNIRGYWSTHHFYIATYSTLSPISIHQTPLVLYNKPMEEVAVERYAGLIMEWTRSVDTPEDVGRCFEKFCLKAS